MVVEVRPEVRRLVSAGRAVPMFVRMAVAPRANVDDLGQSLELDGLVGQEGGCESR